jgi:Flp pilus assembly protein TadG
MMKPPCILGRHRKSASFWRDGHASAAVEMALVLPAIAFIVLNITDLAIYAYTRMQVDLAAQEAVGAARVLCNTSTASRQLPAMQSCTGLDSTIVAAAQTTPLGTGVTLTASSGNHSTEGYYCADSSSTLQLVAAYNGTPPSDCSGTYGGSTVAPGDYISVTATYTFNPVFPGISVASLLTSPITRTAWLRLN